MKKTKTEKGITLIALIITIVVLLILAVVAINSITNDGILSKAESAANKYNQSVKDEKDMLDYYEGYLAGTLWQQDGTKVTKKNEDGTTITLTVGQTVSGYDGYSGSYDGGWAVLGAENGKLLLVSKANVQSSVGLYGKNGDTDEECQAGYYNGIEYLNSLCAPYLNSSLADEARSIKVEDINRVTGYNPESTGDGTRYGAGNPWQYGNTVTYTMSEGYVAYSSDKVTGDNASGTSDYESFEHIDGRTLTATSDPIKVTSNSYYYYPNTLTTSSSGTTNGIETTSDAYKVLFKKANGTSYGDYWLASQEQFAERGFAGFALSAVLSGSVSFWEMWRSEEGGQRGCLRGARGGFSEIWSQYIRIRCNFVNREKCRKFFVAIK